MSILPPSPFLNPDERFVLDEEAFLLAIEPAPAFLATPRSEYLAATQIRPIVDVLAGFMSEAGH